MSALRLNRHSRWMLVYLFLALLSALVSGGMIGSGVFRSDHHAYRFFLALALVAFLNAWAVVRMAEKVHRYRTSFCMRGPMRSYHLIDPIFILTWSSLSGLATYHGVPGAADMGFSRPLLEAIVAGIATAPLVLCANLLVALLATPFAWTKLFRWIDQSPSPA